MRHLHKIKRVPFIVWYSKHELTHILLGLVYAWFLRELWNQFSWHYLWLSIFGSLVIDADHLAYAFTYGRHDIYSVEVRRILKQGQIGTLFKFWRDNHKHNTGLATHNMYILGFCLILGLISLFFDWKVRTVLFGAIVLHLLFDIIDDLWVLGRVNDNWKHLRHKKTTQDYSTHQASH